MVITGILNLPYCTHKESTQYNYDATLIGAQSLLMDRWISK